MPDTPNPLDDLSYDDAQLCLTTFSNRFHITVDAMHVRLVFGQKFVAAEKVRPHSAVVLSVTDAMELARLIQELVTRTRGSPAITDDSNVG